MANPLLRVPVSYVRDVNGVAAELLKIAKRLDALAAELGNDPVRQKVADETNHLLTCTIRLSDLTRVSVDSSNT